MKKIVRNNKTFIINEELYKKIQQNSFQLLEDEQLSLPGLEDNNDKKQKPELKPENKKIKQIDQDKIKRVLNDFAFNAKIAGLYSNICKKVMTVSPAIEEVIKNDDSFPKIIKNLDVKEFLASVLKSRVLFSKFKLRYIKNRFLEDEKISDEGIFFDVFSKLIKSKKFIEGTAMKTLASMQKPNLFNYKELQNNTNNVNNTIANNTSDVTKNPMSEAVLYEDNIDTNFNPSNSSNTENPMSANPSSTNAASNNTLQQNNKNTINNKDLVNTEKSVNKLGDVIINGLEKKLDINASEPQKEEPDNKIDNTVDNAKLEDLLAALYKINPINPLDYTCLSSLIERTRKFISGDMPGDITLDRNEKEIKDSIKQYLNIRNKSIGELKEIKSKITVNNCISFLKDYFDKENKTLKDNTQIALSIRNACKNFKSEKVDFSDENTIAETLTSNLIYFKELQNKELEKLIDSKHEASVYNEKNVKETFDYYEYSKLLEEKDTRISKSASDTANFIDTDIITENNNFIFIYGFCTIMDFYIDKIIVKIFNTPELNSLAKKIKNNINRLLSERENDDVVKNVNFEDAIRKALKYIGNRDISIQDYDRMFDEATKINESINYIVTKATGELQSQMAMFNILHYQLISGDIFDTIKKVCQNDNNKIKSLRELYGYSLLTKACNDNKEKILEKQSFIQKLKSNKAKLADLISEIALRCKNNKDIIDNDIKMKDFYKSNLQSNDSDKLITNALIISLVRIITVHNERQQLKVIDAIRQNNDIKGGYDVEQGYMLGFLGQPLLTLTFTKDDKFYGTIVFMHTFATFNKLFGDWSKSNSISGSLRRLLRM